MRVWYLGFLNDSSENSTVSEEYILKSGGFRVIPVSESSEDIWKQQNEICSGIVDNFGGKILKIITMTLLNSLAFTVLNNLLTFTHLFLMWILWCGHS